jgi:hypothetical protein
MTRKTNMKVLSENAVQLTSAKILYKCPEVNAYIQSLNDAELQAMKIAKDHLKSSFQIKKSVGFLEYIHNVK